MKRVLEFFKNNKIVAFSTIFFILVASITMGAAIISKSLSINGRATIKENSWIIYFDNVRVSSDSVSSTNNAKIVDKEKTTIKFDANLKDPGDFYEFTVYTVNDGTLDAMVKSITKTALTEEQQKYLEFDVTYDNGQPIQECDELNAGTRRRIKAVVKFKKNLDINDYPKDDVNLSLQFSIDYVQKDDACPPRAIEDQNVLTIIPNGGIYNNRADEVRIYLDKGEQYNVLEPTRKLYNFDGWEVVTPTENGTYTFEDNLFTMGDEDVTIQANWKEGDYVARIMNTYFPTIQSALDAAKKDKWENNTVYLLRDTTESPTNNTSDEVTFNLDGHTVTGTFTNSKDGNLTIVNGKFRVAEGGTKAFVNYGTLNMGKDDKEVQVESSIAIIGAASGLVNEPGSKFYFYDGYIEGITGLVGGYTDKAAGYSVFVDHRNEDNWQRVYLVKSATRAIVKTITNGEMYYYNLQDAILSVQSNKINYPNDDDYVMYATRNFEAAYGAETDDHTRLFLDLFGYSVSTGETITNNTYFKIYNSKDANSTIKSSFTMINNGNLEMSNLTMLSTTDNDVLLNNGNLKLSSVTMQGTKGYGVKNSKDATLDLDENTVLTATDGYGLYNESDLLSIDAGTIYGFYNKGTAVIDGTTNLRRYQYVSSVNSGNFYAINNSGTITMNNGNVSTTVTNDLIYNTGTFNYNGGTINAEKTAVYNRGGKFYANASSISSNDLAVNNQGTFVVDGAEVYSTSTYAISNGSNVTINSGKVYTEKGVAITSSGSVNIYDGEVYSLDGNAINNGGTVNVYGGTVTGTEYAIGTGSGTVNVEGGTITSSDIGIGCNTANIKGGVITSENNAVVTNNANISGGTITSNLENAVTINSNGTITGGNITGDIYGVYGLDKSKITIGNDEGEISITVPTIVGGSYGLYTEGTVTNFYDGILKGQIDGYYGNITGTPLGATVVSGTETINDNLYQTDYLINYENWLKVGDQEFNSIDAASQAIESEGTITVIKDANITFIQNFINNDNSDKKITFDLNGHTVTTSQSIYNNVDLTIVDSSSEKTGTLNANRVTGIVNNSSLTLDGGNYVSDVVDVIDNKRTATMVINSANINTKKNSILNAGTITINDVTLNSEEYGIYNRSTNIGGSTIYDGTVIMYNGEITGNAAGIASGSLKMEGGLIKSSKDGTYNTSVTMNGGKIQGTAYGINGGGATINNGVVSSVDNNAIYSYGGTITVNGGTVESQNNTAILSHSNININGGTVTGTRGIKNEIYCSYNSCWWYDITIKGGTITGTTSEGVFATGGDLYFYSGTSKGATYGVYVASANTAQIGTDDGKISITDPVLIGDVHGLNTVGYTKFYDGILKGKTLAHEGLISLIPEGTSIYDDYEYIDRVEYKTQYLVEKGNWLKVGDQEFNSINKAAEAITDTGTITVIADAYVDFDQEFPNGKNITFDLNGHSVNMTRTLINRGNVTIIDSLENGYINNVEATTITNNGTLTINGGIFDSTIKEPISNSGTLTINGGTINGYKALYNSNSLTINGGHIEAKDTNAITTSGNTVINGGEIVSGVSNAINISGSTTTINNGTITSTAGIAVNVSGTTTLNVKGGKITGTTGIVANNYKISLNVSGGNIVGTTNNGINTSSVALITGGVIEGANYGVYSNGTTTIGNDDGVISIDLPVLKGELYGLYIYNGTVNFNDGILKGITDSYYGQITNIPDRTNIFYDTEIINEVEYQTAYLLTESVIAINLQTNKEYTNLQDALDEAGDGETVQLIANVPLYYQVVNDNSASITLDLNGHTISTNKQIINRGIITLSNSNSNEAIVKTSSSLDLINNTGTLTLNNVTLKNNSTSNFVVNNQGNLTMTNAKIDSINGVRNASVMEANSSNIVSTNTAINNTGKLTINAGTYTGKDYSVFSNTTQAVVITDANLNGTYYNSTTSNAKLITSNLNGSLSNQNSTLLIKGSKVFGTTGENVSNNGTLTLEKSTVEFSSPSAYSSTTYVGLTNNKNLTINNSTIKVDTERNYRYYVNGINNSGTLNINNESNIYVGNGQMERGSYIGIRTTSSGVTNIEDSSIFVMGSEKSYGVYLADTDSKVNLLTGRVDVRGSSTGYGAYINLGTFTMGHLEGTGIESEDVSTTDPVVYSSASSYGIGVKKINGYFNFYDGEIRASRYAKPETTSNVEYNYEVTTYVDYETGFEFAILEYMRNDYDGDAVAILNGVYYTNLQDAIDKCENNDEITMLKSISEDVEVKADQIVLINLNGHSVTGKVTNNGTLQVYNGSLQNIDDTAVVNANDDAVFIMGQDDDKVSSTSVRVMSEVLAIDNTVGEFYMYDGYIQGLPTIATDVTAIPRLSRIYTEKDSQAERKYLQSLSEESIKNGETDLLIEIDPNGGYYNDTKEITTIYLKYLETYTLLVPTKNGCTFIGWEISDESVLNGDVITINLSDIQVKAKWEISEAAVAKIGNEYYTSMQEAITAAKEGDKIELLKDITEDVTNNKNITIDLSGYKITGQFVNQGILKLLNGTIENTDGVGLINKKTLTLGENDGEIVEDSIKIIGTTVGLQQDGKFNFYDGYIEGEVALNGKTDSVPKGYFLYVEPNQEKGCQRVYLIGNPENAVAAINDGGGTQYFFSLQDAINTAKVTKNEILIVRDFEATYPITVDEGSEVSINMSGYDITTGNNITNNGNLKLYDTSETAGSITSAKTIVNNGTLTIDNISITETTTSNTINNTANATLNINGIDITAKSGYAIYNEGTLNLSGDYNLVSTSYALNNKGNELNINSGTIMGIETSSPLVVEDGSTINANSSKSAIIVHNDTSVTVNGGELTSTSSYVISNDGEGASVTINDGTLNGSTGLYCNGKKSKYVVNGGTLTATSNGVKFNVQECELEMTGGSITSTSYGVLLSSNLAKVNVSGGSITATNSTGIYDGVGKNTTYMSEINISGGTVTGTDYGMYMRDNYVNVSGGSITSKAQSRDRYALFVNEECITNISGTAKIGSETSSAIYSYSQLQIDGGEIYTSLSNGYGIYLETGTLTMNDGLINTTGNSSYSIYCGNYNKNIYVNGGKITSKNIGVYLRATNANYYSRLYLNSGTIAGDTYGIYLNSEASVATIGNLDEELSTTAPLVTGGTYGIYNASGSINFYNGRLRGYTYGYNGGFDNVRSKKEIAEEAEEISASKGYLTYSTLNYSAEALSDTPKVGNGAAKLTYLGEDTDVCIKNQEYNFDFLEAEQTFIAQCPGTYKVEVWGAQGQATLNGVAGYGGYSTGEITLARSEKLFIYTGGQTGYNGGGAGSVSGGGATHIATQSGLLNTLASNKDSIIIVAGGGGGAERETGGSGGGFLGGNGILGPSNGYRGLGEGGTQTNGGSGSTYYISGYPPTGNINGSFGTGGLGTSSSDSGPGGGGGYYGGGATTQAGGAGGGSGYIGSTRLSNGYMYGYNVESSKNSWINNYLVEKQAFLQVEDETFNDFADAYAAVTDGGTIKVIQNATVNVETSSPSDKAVTIDLNGHTLTMTQPITNNNTMTITDNTDEYGSIVNEASDIIINNGTLNVNKIDITGSGNTAIVGSTGTGSINITDGSTIKNAIGVKLNSAQTLSLNKADVITTDSAIRLLVAGCTVNAIDSNIEGPSYGIYVNGNKSTIDIDNCNIKSQTTSSGYPIYNNVSANAGYQANMTVDNSKLEGYYYAAYVRDTNITFNNSELSITRNGNGYYVLYCSDDSVCTINEGTVINAPTASGVAIASNAKVIMNGGEINALASNSYGVNFTSTSSAFEMNGGTINAPGTSSYGILANYYNKTITINDGTITSGNVGILLSANSTSYKSTLNINGGSITGSTYGVQSTYSTNTINIGSKDSELSTKIPYISGGNYGIYRTAGVINYYNGRLRGVLYGFNDLMTDVRSGMDIYAERELIGENDLNTISVGEFTSEPMSNKAKEGNGYVRLTYLGESNDNCTNGTTYEFEYTGAEQEFVVSCAGNYSMEAWGAQGATYSGIATGGYGGYSYGEITLEESEILYINVGGVGTEEAGGYNGGGLPNNYNVTYAGGGGGATHVATQSGLLSTFTADSENLIMVAGGGAGAYVTSSGNWHGNSGGGAIGGYSFTESNAGTQSSGYAFGKSNDVAVHSSSTNYSGGGGGYYGGYSSWGEKGAGGGSGYIANSRLTNAKMYGYHVYSDAYVNNYLVEKVGFLKVGDQVFNSFDQAFAAIEETGTVVVLNSNLVQEASTIVEGKNITIDLNGKTITSTQLMTNNGNLTITDNSESKNGKFVNSRTNLINNNGDLTVSGVTLSSSSNYGIYGQSNTGTITITDNATVTGSTGIYLNSAQTLILDSGTVKGSTGINLYSDNSKFTMNSGLVEGSSYGIYSYGYKNELTINDGEIKATNGVGIYDTRSKGTSNFSKLDVLGGEISGTTHGVRVEYMTSTFTNTTISTSSNYNYHYALYFYSSAECTLNKGTKLSAQNASGVYSHNGILTVDGATIDATAEKSYGINLNSGTLNFKSGNINTPGTAAAGIELSSSVAVVNMDGGTIESGNIGVYIYNSNSTKTVNINKGQIIAKTYGIYQTISNGIINLGSLDDSVSVTEPYVEGGLYGIYKTAGTSRFYSGLLKGYTSAYNGAFNVIRDGYEIFEGSMSQESYLELGQAEVATNYSSEPIAKTAKEGNGYAKVTYTSTTSTIAEDVAEEVKELSCNAIIGQEYIFDATGDYQEFVTQCRGVYKVELWGAQGGYRSNSTYGGKGGYTSGYINLENSDKLYVYVGLSGNNGGFNGGGTRTIGHGGGGATDIRLNTSLYSRIMVAGGGGSDGGTSHSGGAGGGLTGESASGGCGTGGEGGTQTAGGSLRSDFGYGGNGLSQSNGYGGAGGGGWYGGGGTTPDGSGDDDRGGGGGSAFAYTSDATIPSNYLVDKKYQVTSATLLDGDSAMPSHDSTTSINGNTGNGYAKITFIGATDVEEQVQEITPDADLDEYCKNLVGTSYTFDPTGEKAMFDTKCSGKYKVELWGAQGGYRSKSANGGKGGYTSGYINLTQTDNLYVYVGLSGNNGGFNGGGTRTIGYGGGGATDIRLSDSLYSRIMVAAGGGSDGSSNNAGAAAGGLTGNSSNGGCGSGGEGATQTAGGSYRSLFGYGGSGQSAYGGHGGAGGGGWYGGGGANVDGSGDDDKGGGGGSSYAYTESAELLPKYNATVSSRFMVTDATLIGGAEEMPTQDKTSTMTGNSGDGYAVITFTEYNPSLNYTNKYKIKLETKVGKVENSELTYNDGDTLGEIPQPVTDDEYLVFKGWYLDSEYTKKVTASTIIHSSGTLYAKFVYNDTYCESLLNQEYTFEYTGGEQTLPILCSGTYKLEVWGAQGGDSTYGIVTNTGGYGGYSSGEVELNKGENLYIAVGGKGGSATYNSTASFDSSTGYNGGGYGAVYTDNSAHGGGGGATHIATSSGLLANLEVKQSNLLIVAGGGGGASTHKSNPSYTGDGGSGGGTIGGSGIPVSNTCYNYGTGGTQTSGGTFIACANDGRIERAGEVTPNPTFGIGANYSQQYTGSYAYSGGGGGYYGGQSGYHAPGGGGSGYTGNTRLTNAYMLGYKANTIAYLIEANEFVKNVETGTTYTNLQTAIDEATSGNTLQLVSNGYIYYDITIPSAFNLKLDMNGQSLTVTKAITNNGNVEIINNTGINSSITSDINSLTLFKNKGSLSIQNVDVTGYNIFENSSGGTLVLQSVKATAKNNALINYSGVTISDSNISATTDAINNYSNGQLNIDNSSIFGQSYSIYSNSNRNITVENSSLSSNNYALYNYTDNDIELIDTTVNGKIYVRTSSSNLDITGGTIVGTIGNVGNLTIDGTQLSRTTDTNGNEYIIDNTGILNINNATLEFTNTTNGDYNYYTRIIYNAGTVTSTGNKYVIKQTGSNHSKYLVGIYSEGLLSSVGDSYEISGGNISRAIYSESSNLATISNISANLTDSNSIYVIETKTGNAEITGGTITATDATNIIGLRISDGEVTSENVAYNLTNGTNVNGVTLGTGTLNFKNGSIYANATGTAYGIKIDSGTLNLGIEDGSGTDAADVSITDPRIEAIGTTSGIGISTGNGTFNFYDGIIIGSTSARGESDITSSTDKNYQVITKTDEETGYEYEILEFIK